MKIIKDKDLKKLKKNEIINLFKLIQLKCLYLERLRNIEIERKVKNNYEIISHKYRY